MDQQTQFPKPAYLTLGVPLLLSLKEYSMKLRPLDDRVVVLPKAAEKQSAGGIILPAEAQEKPSQGRVVAVGPGSKDKPTTVKVGDEVIYGKYAGAAVDDLIIMRESDIFAVLEK